MDEVIKERILKKDDVAKETLKLLYQDKESILKNLITFSADTPEMKTYKTEDDFIEVYPFIPYQFNLLQSVFTGIRHHGASGKHLSEGERSLLSAFQESAIAYKDSEIGTLIPFSAFYDTVEAFLDSNIRTVIFKAEDNDNLNQNDVEVLKVLFLIKYVKEMPSNIENIATLIVKNIDGDKIELKKQIEESLRRLLKETLIQKNGNEYIFLTHEEQDVNKEIQNITIDTSEILLKVGEEIFEGIYSEKKYRYNARYHFDFNKIIDDRLVSPQKHEIGLKIITPYYDTGVELNEQELKLMAARENNLLIKLPDDTTFLEEMEEILKIQTYMLRKGGTKSTSEIEEIKIRKGREVVERKERVRSLLMEALKSADIYANSQKLDIKVKHPIERINDGFKQLVEGIYYKLNYINTFVETNKDLYEILTENDMQMRLTDDIPNKLAVDEVNSLIERNTERNIPITLKTIISLYSKVPYGWKELDIIAIILYLFKSQEIKLQLGVEYLNIYDKDLISCLTKKDNQDRLIVKKRVRTPAKFINNAKDLAKEIFGYTSMPNDEDGLMERFKQLCQNELTKLNRDTGDYGIKFLIEKYKNNKQYPGKDVLDNGEKLFEEIIKIKDVKEFYERLYELKDDLLDYEENVFDVKRFFKNQVEQFEKAVEKLEIYEKNKTYVIDKDTIKIVEEIQSIVNSKEPYSQIHKLPNLIDEFVDKFFNLLEVECSPIRVVIENDFNKVIEELNKYSFKDELFDKFKERFDNLLDRLDSANNFYEAIAMKEESDRIKIRCFDEIEKERIKRKPKVDTNTSGISNGTSAFKSKKVVNVSIANVLHGAKTIETVQDIDEVIEQIRNALIAQLKEDTKIKLI